MKNLRNYIGSGGGNQPGDHQNRPRSWNIIIFALWMIFCEIPQEMMKFSDFQYISVKLGTLAARCWNDSISYGISMVLGTPFAHNPLHFVIFIKFNRIYWNLMKFSEMLWLFVILRYFCVSMWSGWSRAPQNHQYSYRNINVLSREPQGTLQVAQKLIFTGILLNHWNLA